MAYVLAKQELVLKVVKLEDGEKCVFLAVKGVKTGIVMLLQAFATRAVKQGSMKLYVAQVRLIFL